jgi:hypothetical protein
MILDVTLIIIGVLCLIGIIDLIMSAIKDERSSR